MTRTIKASEIAAEIALGLVTGQVLAPRSQSLGDELADSGTFPIADTGSLDHEVEIALLQIAHQNGTKRVRQDVERVTALRNTGEGRSGDVSTSSSKKIAGAAVAGATGIGAIISSIVSGITAILGFTVIAAGAAVVAAAVAMIASLF